jgi:hypothetical protein
MQKTPHDSSWCNIPQASHPPFIFTYIQHDAPFIIDRYDRRGFHVPTFPAITRKPSPSGRGLNPTDKYP